MCVLICMPGGGSGGGGDGETTDTTPTGQILPVPSPWRNERECKQKRQPQNRPILICTIGQGHGRREAAKSGKMSHLHSSYTSPPPLINNVRIHLVAELIENIIYITLEHVLNKWKMKLNHWRILFSKEGINRA